MKTAKRKCITCGEKVSSVNSGTSTMKTHWQKCQTNVNRTRKRNYDLHEISFPKSQTNRCAAKGHSEVARLAYEDRISVNRVTMSPILQKWFKRMNFDPVSPYSLNKSLDEEYHFLHHKVQAFISSRDAKQPPVISFDKWTSVDQEKFIGVYLYVQSKAIAVNIKNLLKAFNLIPSDIRIAVTDCGADVNAASTLCGWFNFPCLTHVINLIAKKLISPPTDEEAAPNENDWDYNSESESESSQSENLSLCNNYGWL